MLSEEDEEIWEPYYPEEPSPITCGFYDYKEGHFWLTLVCIERPCICHELCCFVLLSMFLLVILMSRNIQKLECGPMPNVMVALPNIGGAVCSTPHGI